MLGLLFFFALQTGECFTGTRFKWSAGTWPWTRLLWCGQGKLRDERGSSTSAQELDFRSGPHPWSFTCAGPCAALLPTTGLSQPSLSLQTHLVSSRLWVTLAAPLTKLKFFLHCAKLCIFLQLCIIRVLAMANLFNGCCALCNICIFSFSPFIPLHF